MRCVNYNVNLNTSKVLVLHAFDNLQAEFTIIASYNHENKLFMPHYSTLVCISIFTDISLFAMIQLLVEVILVHSYDQYI